MHPSQGKTLSNLIIDTDKGWRVKGISNIKQVAEGMEIGHIVQQNGTKLETLAPGKDGHVLTSQGPGKLLTWAPGGTYFYRYFPVTIDLAKSYGIVVPGGTKAIFLPVGTSYENQLTPTLSPEPELNLGAGLVTPDYTKAVTAPMTSGAYFEMLLDGAIAHYGDPAPSDHDELAESRSDTADDMHLPPQYPHDPPDEYYLFGCLIKFDAIYIEVSTAGVGNYAVESIQYWNGGAWGAPADLEDNLNDFQATGISWSQWTVPGDWALLNIGGYTLYWLKIACSAMVTLTTAPLGKNVWLRLDNYI